MNQTTFNKYLVSSVITFVTAFLITLGAQLSMGTIDPSNIGWATVGALFFAAMRAGIKAVVEKSLGVSDNNA